MKMNLPNLRFLPLILLVPAAFAGEISASWLADAQHPLLQYRFECNKGTETVFWRSGYPGAVTLQARLRSSSYDGMEDVRIDPQSEARSPLETMYCGTFQVTVAHFSMEAPPVPKPTVPSTPAADAAEPPAPPAVPGLLRFEPRAEPLAQVTPEALESVKVGMKEAEVLQKLGTPVSKMSIPEEGKLMGTYRYNVADGRTSGIRFENGVVTEIVSSR
jgi:hypothetical protein